MTTTARPREGEWASVRLTDGGHSSPAYGVCVVELASLIAGEEFSDRPRCVCPVIAAFLRGWNDRAGYAERQLLGPYAVRIVGSRGDRRLTRNRREICLAWAGVDPRDHWIRRLASRFGIELRIAIFSGIRATLRRDEAIGDYVARVAFESDDAGRGLDLLEALLAAGGNVEAHEPEAPGGRPGMNGNGRMAPSRNGAPPRGLNGDGPSVGGTAAGSSNGKETPDPAGDSMLAAGRDRPN